MDDPTLEPLFASALTVRLRYANGQPALFVDEQAVTLEALSATLLHRRGQKPCPLEVLVHRADTDAPNDREAFLSYIRAAQSILRQHHFKTIHY